MAPSHGSARFDGIGVGGTRARSMDLAPEARIEAGAPLRTRRHTTTARLAWTRIASSKYLGALTLVGSMLVAGAILMTSFGAGNVMEAMEQANILLLALVVILGGVIQLVRAQRAQLMLSGDHEATLPHTYAAMVMGHGLGDLLPLAPGGPVLRCVLTERLSAIPVGFSAGVFMLEGMLDGLGPALLTGYLLAALTIPAWTRWALMAALVQSALVFLVPILVKILSRYAHWAPLRNRRVAGLMRLGHQVADGLVAVLKRGARTIGSVIGLSLVVTALSALQMILFLRAFGLGTSINNLLLMLVLTLASGSMPLKIPGAGTLATTELLRVAAIHGPGLAGYVLVSRVILSSETAFLALAMLGWWSITGQWQRIGVHSLASVFKGRLHPEPIPVTVERASPR